MTKAEFISRIDGFIRPYITKLNPELVTKIYSSGRKYFINTLSKEIPKNIYIPRELKRKIWDIEFNSPLFNAAGMFKKGEAYYTCASQGAGAYLAGTTTENYRRGNYKNGIMHPFISYFQSGAASNWMGLPNEGHDVVAKKLSHIDKVKGCPVGASLSISPELDEKTALASLLNGLTLYNKASVDFIELNESCPNVPHGHDYDNATGLDRNLINRLEFVHNKFLKRRIRNIPLILKLSNDTDPELIPNLIDIMISMDYDGINFGNTSINYEGYLNKIHKEDQKNYQYFTQLFGGGLSGRILKDVSLDLSSKAVEYLQSKNSGREFHVIRTGGIENSYDIADSLKAGIYLNQWFTGYFENFSSFGHSLYSELLKILIHENS